MHKVCIICGLPCLDDACESCRKAILYPTKEQFHNFKELFDALHDAQRQAKEVADEINSRWESATRTTSGKNEPAVTSTPQKWGKYERQVDNIILLEEQSRKITEKYIRLRLQAEELMNKLPKQERSLIWHRYYDRFTIEKCAELERVSVSKWHRKHNSIIKKLNLLFTTS